MPDMPKICKRCLLAEAGETALIRSLEELRSALPDEEKADKEEYGRRLAICGECGELNAGTCMKCGCYVEFRALKKRMHCPSENKKW